MAPLETFKAATQNTTQQDGGIEDFLSTMMADYKQSKTGQNWHLGNPEYTSHSDSTGQLKNVTNADGKQIMTFSNYKDGKPMQIEMSDGSQLKSYNGGITYECLESNGTLSPFGLTNLTIDDRGNITFDSPTGKDSRVTVAADGTTIERPNS